MPLDYPHGGCFIDIIYLLPLCDSRLKFLPTAADANAGALCNYTMHVILLLLLFVLELWLEAAISNDIGHKDPPRPQPACGLKYGVIPEAAWLRRRSGGDEE